MATIHDVAARAGVSAATVSRVLNGRRVRADLEAAVRDAARDLDFEPNRAAQNLRRRISEVVSLIVPDIENPFFTSIARGAAEVTAEAGYSLVLCNTDSDQVVEERYLEIAARDRVAGVLLASTAPQAPSASRSRRPLVAVDRDLPEALDRVLLANREIAARVTSRLAAGGAIRIACVTGPGTAPTAVERLDGWGEALRRAGLRADPQLVAHTDFRVASAQEAAARLMALAEPPDAILAANNLAGVGVLRGIAAQGGAAPAVGVIGDLPFATGGHDGVIVEPLPTRELGRRAAGLLIARAAGDDGPPHRVVLGGSDSRD